MKKELLAAELFILPIYETVKMETVTKGATKNADGSNAEKKKGDQKEIEKVEEKNEESSKVDMAGFTFYANACEEKLKLFLEELFSNKKTEDFYYVEANLTDKTLENGGEEQDAENNEIDKQGDESPDKQNFLQRNTIKSNYDKMAINLVEEVEQFMKPFINDRYKIVVQGVIGENKKQGVHIASKSLWNVETDNYVSAKYVNDYIFVTVMVFLLYNE